MVDVLRAAAKARDAGVSATKANEDIEKAAALPPSIFAGRGAK